MYSPSPWFSEALIKKVCDDELVDRRDKGAAALARGSGGKSTLASTPSGAAPASSRDIPGTDDGTPAAKSGRSAVKSSKGKTTGRKRKAALDEEEDEDEEDAAVIGGQISAAAAAGTAAGYLRDKARFTRDLIDCVLEPVAQAQLEALPEFCCRGAVIETGTHLRVRDRVDFGRFPGLREALIQRHKTQFLHESIDFESIVRLLETGSECGKLQLCTVHDRDHPLTKVAGAGNFSGTFSRWVSVAMLCSIQRHSRRSSSTAISNLTACVVTGHAMLPVPLYPSQQQPLLFCSDSFPLIDCSVPIAAGECLGFYPGVLMHMKTIEYWMARLPRDDKS